MGTKQPKKNNAKKSTAKSKLSPAVIVVIVAVIAAAAVAGVLAGVLVKRGGSGSDSSSSGSGSGNSVKPPDFAYAQAAPKGAAKAYQFAIDHPDILAQIPCYCGCGQEAGHTSNLDCFIKSRNGNEVTFDDHASY